MDYPNKSHTALTQEQMDWAYKKWCDGYTCIQIADALYVSEKTVRRAFKGKKRIRTILVYDGE